MITKYKIYEKLNHYPPTIGNYAIVKSKAQHSELSEFINNNIGKIVSDEDDQNIYRVSYDNIPVELKNFFNDINSRGFGINQIKYWSKNKKELEALLDAKKYNL